MLEDVFDSLDPFDEPFTANAPQRLILYPAHGYELSDSAWSALTVAALALGDRTAYYATVEGQAARELQSVWEVALSDETAAWFESSASNGTRNPLAESALWSPSGGWGLLVSHEQHVIVGGTNEFATQLLAHVPDADEQAKSFIRDVAHYASDIKGTVPWLRSLLIHVYGEARADGLLAASTAQE